MLLTGVNLPRGTGIVTRCPLQVEIHNEATARTIIHYTAANGTAKDLTIDANGVNAAVIKAQEDIAGSYGVIDSLIRLEVYYPNAPVRLQPLSCKYGQKNQLQKHVLVCRS